MDFSRAIVNLGAVLPDVAISAVSDDIRLLANPKIVKEMKGVWSWGRLNEAGLLSAS